MAPAYLVIIGDMIGSRKVIDRSLVQKRLASQLALINQHTETLISPYTLTLGDEFQAVFQAPGGLFASLLSITDAIFPQEIRFAIAAGAITTVINREQAIGMDGPAFHRARDLIVELKKKKRYCLLATPEGKYDALFSATAEILFSRIFKYKKSNRASLLLQAMEGKAAAEIAGKEKVSYWNVLKNMGNWHVPEAVVQMKEMERLLRECI